jgi:hypothetical protein
VIVQLPTRPVYNSNLYTIGAWSGPFMSYTPVENRPPVGCIARLGGGECVVSQACGSIVLWKHRLPPHSHHIDDRLIELQA